MEDGPRGLDRTRRVEDRILMKMEMVQTLLEERKKLQKEDRILMRKLLEGLKK